MPIYANPQRAVFTVVQHGKGWAVEHEGRFFDSSPLRDDVVASASRRARACNDQGRPSQIRIEGEHGFTLR
jgi:hypothetical protein